MTDIPHHRRSPLDHGRDAPKPAHTQAAFINAIAEEGTKAEAVERLQMVWNERCEMADTIAALRAQRAREREAGDRLVAAIDRTTDKAWASVATMEDAICLDAALAAFRAAREGGG